MATPGAARERQLLEGDVPSPLDPPAGCHLNTRCPFVATRCRSERPQLTGGTHATACHRVDELPPAGAIVPREARASPVLERLIGAFATTEARAG